jgi:hypothetical protein
MQQEIRIRGARGHDLRNTDVDLPPDSLVEITGPSLVTGATAGPVWRTRPQRPACRSPASNSGTKDA